MRAFPRFPVSHTHMHTHSRTRPNCEVILQHTLKKRVRTSILARCVAAAARERRCKGHWHGRNGKPIAQQKWSPSRGYPVCRWHGSGDKDVGNDVGNDDGTHPPTGIVTLKTSEPDACDGAVTADVMFAQQHLDSLSSAWSALLGRHCSVSTLVAVGSFGPEPQMYHNRGEWAK
jgi:hypothetical protein